MAVRAKFMCHGVIECSWSEGAKEVSLGPVYESAEGIEGNACEENRIFGEATPSGHLEMVIANPEAAAQFEAGKCYYLDFTPAE